MATRFVTKTVFLNQGVNQGSNFPGLTPHPKGRPQPKLSKKKFGGFLKKICLEKYLSENNFD